MKRTKIASFLMLTIVLALSVMSFVGPTPDYYCYLYGGPRPVTDAEVIKKANYTQQSINTALSCGMTPQIWCGFCIETGSPYFDATGEDVKWTDDIFIAMLKDRESVETYNDATNLNDTELDDGVNAHSGVFVYFKPI